MNDSIIAGYDCSDASRAATDWAAREAGLRGLPLELLQAWPWPPGRPLGTGQAERWGREQLAVRADQIRTAHPGLEVRAHHTAQDAVGLLLAAGDRAALLVLGSRGLGALRGFLVGSVSQQVLVRAACPVVLVRNPADGQPEPDTAGRDVMVGLDPARPCDCVLGFAFEAAALRQAPLTAVHAWSPPAGTEHMSFGAIGGLEDQLAATERQRLDDALAPWLDRYPDVPVAAESLRGHAGITLVDAAARTDLLVVGARHRRGPLGAHLGPVTHAVLHHVRSPVVVVPTR
ncbi:universal stress protein [Kitasatospora sp. RB6PN24]|uniref:universal stress protein n=1 Tax=Kitasatospora humi TaxID=2893891 RepID=UPI001E652DD8|nr:universal stress protein [Kitasatospora humi]MCC9307819.1 universal stress protein [Kitasatospora humi]